MTNMTTENTLNTTETTITPETVTENTLTTPETTRNLRSLHKEVKPIETDNYYDVKDIATAKGFNKVYLGNKKFNIDPSKKYMITVISFKTKATRDKKNLSNNLVKTKFKNIEFASKNNAINTLSYIKNELKQQNLKASVACLITEDDYKTIIHNNPTATPAELQALIHEEVTFYLIDGRPLTDHYAAIATAEVKQAEKEKQQAERANHRATSKVDNSVTDAQKQNILSQLAA